MSHCARSVAALLLLLVNAGARAEKKAVLMESYAGPRPPGMAHYADQIANSFGPARLVYGDELKKRLTTSFSRPVTRATAEELQALVQRATDGGAAFTSSSFTLAISELTRAVDGLANQSAALAAEPKLRDVRRNALFKLANAQVKVNNPSAAQATLGEAVRSFPEIQSFSEAQFPPRVVAIGNRVLADKAEQGGTLTVETQPSRRRFFLNEQLAGMTPRTITGLLPGTYRLYVASNDPTRGAVRLVEVKPRTTTTVVIDSEVDDHLETENYVGLRFATHPEKQRLETPIACAIAREVGADEVILLTLQQSPSSETELLGAVYKTESGHREWGVILPLAPAPDDSALARFALSLRTRREVEGVKVAPEPSPPPAPKAAAVPSPVLSNGPRLSEPRLRLGRGVAIALGTSLGLATATTAAWLGSYYGYGCSGPTGSEGTDPMSPCAPGSTGRYVDASFFTLMLAGWSVGTASLIMTLVEYIEHRQSVKKGTVTVGRDGTTSFHF